MISSKHELQATITKLAKNSRTIDYSDEHDFTRIKKKMYANARPKAKQFKSVDNKTTPDYI